MTDYMNKTPEQIGEARAEEARRVTSGYTIDELKMFPDGSLRRYELATLALEQERDRLRAAIVAYRTAVRTCNGIADAEQALFAALGEE